MEPSEKKLPSFEQGEQVVLGYLLRHPESVQDISTRLPEDAFSIPTYRQIYSAVINNFEKDTGLLVDAIRQTTGNEDVIIQLEEFIRELESVEGDALDIYEYIDKLVDFYLRRRAILLLRNSSDKLFDASTESSGVFSDVVSFLAQGDFVAKSLVQPGNIVVRREEGLKSRREHGFIPTGYTLLDRHLAEGFSPGTLSIIAGRPSMGKSTFKRNCIVRLCERGYGVLSFVPEMGFDREQDGIDAIRTGRVINDFYRNISDQAAADALASSNYIANNWNYVVQENPFIDFASIERDIQFVLRTRTLNVVFIDLFDRIREISEAGFDKHNVIKNLLQRQAAIGRKYNIHFCDVVQIRRIPGIKDVISKFRPTIDLLKDSGAYEEVADVVLLLYCAGYYDETIPNDNVEIIIGKQRVGVRNKSAVLDAYWDRGLIEETLP